MCTYAWNPTVLGFQTPNVSDNWVHKISDLWQVQVSDMNWIWKEEQIREKLSNLIRNVPGVVMMNSAESLSEETRRTWLITSNKCSPSSTNDPAKTEMLSKATNWISVRAVLFAGPSSGCLSLKLFF